MNRKVSLFVLLGCVVCIAAFMVAFTAENGELKLKKSHSFASSKNHEWSLVDGYPSSDTDCQNKCANAKGMSCGSKLQNCCNAKDCKTESHWYGDTQTCGNRVVVDGCTKPK